MSHIATYHTRIRVKPLPADSEAAREDPSWQLLREAVAMTANELGGQVTDSVRDYYDAVRWCDIGIITPDFSRGVGLRVVRQTGEIHFLYDPYGDRSGAAKRICDRVTQNYTTLATVRALQALNYDIEIETTEEGPTGRRLVTIRGVD